MVYGLTTLCLLVLALAFAGVALWIGKGSPSEALSGILNNGGKHSPLHQRLRVALSTRFC